MLWNVLMQRELFCRLEDVEGLSILGTSEVSVIAFGSSIFNPYILMDELGKRGWLLNSLQYPPA